MQKNIALLIVANKGNVITMGYFIWSVDFSSADSLVINFLKQKENCKIAQSPMKTFVTVINLTFTFLLLFVAVFRISDTPPLKAEITLG